MFTKYHIALLLGAMQHGNAEKLPWESCKEFCHGKVNEAYEEGMYQTVDDTSEAYGFCLIDNCDIEETEISLNECLPVCVSQLDVQQYTELEEEVSAFIEECLFNECGF